MKANDLIAAAVSVVGGAMVRVALTGYINAAKDLIAGRELGGVASAISGRELTEIFRRHAASRG